MAEEEDDYPPEVHKGEKEFLFRMVASFHLLEEDFRSDKRRLNLMTFANIFGLTIVASKNGFKGYKSDDLMKTEARVAIFDVELQSSPCWIAVSSNNLTLVVCCTGEHGLQALFFDMRHLMNESKPAKVAFSDLDLPVNCASDSIADLHWNPSTEINKETGSIENGKFLAICINTGAFLMLAVEETVKYHATQPAGFGASAVCWSPRGKQVMIGKSDGSLQQYTPTMELKRSVPAWDALDRSVRVSDVLWLSTFQVALTYTTSPQSITIESPNLLIVQLPSSKEPNKKPQWQLYEDPNYAPGRAKITKSKKQQICEESETSTFLEKGRETPELVQIKKRQEVCGESETFTFLEKGRESNGSVRIPRSFMNYIEKWNLFAYLTSTSAETSLLGKNKETNKWEIWSLEDKWLARVPYGRQSDDEPFVIGTGIILTSTENVVLDERDYGKMPVLALLSCDGVLTLYYVVGRNPNQFPPVTNIPTAISFTGDRTKSPPPQFGGGLLDKTKQKLTAKPSIRATTTPLNFPASSSSLFSPPPVAASPSLHPPSPLATFPTSEAPPPPSKPPSPPPPVKVEQPVSVARVPTTPSSVVKSFFPTHSTSTPAAATLPSATSFLPTALAPSSGLNVQSTVPAKVEQKAADPPVSAPPPPPPPPAVTAETRGKKTLIPPDILVEVEDFQRELTRFLDNSSLKKEIESLGTQKMKTEHVAAVNELTKFKREIASTIKEQHADIEDTSCVCIEAFASLRNFEKQKERAKNSKFRETLLSRPLDSNDQKSMKEIRCLYQYVKETVRDADATLNDQWASFMDASNSNHKSRRQVEMEERDKVHRAVVNQTKILHGQENKLTFLSQTLDRLRLQRTANWRGDSCTDIYLQYDKELRDLNRSISNIKIKDAKSEKLVDGRNDSTARKRSHEVRVMKSNRSMELNNWLSSRTRTPVRTTVKKYRNSSMMFQQSPQHSSPIKPTEHSLSTVDDRSSPVAGLRSSSVVDLRSALAEGHIRTSSTSSAESSEYEIQQTIKTAPAAAAVPSKSLIGSSTITYGAPDGGGKHQIPSSLYDASVTQHKEAESNLNNPPLVVNIKELKEPQVLTVPTFSPKFKPTSADVPIGAAQEVQKVLNTVIAEKQSGTTLPPTLQSSATESSLSSTSKSCNPPPAYPSSVCQATKGLFSSHISNQGNTSSMPAIKVDSSSALGGTPTSKLPQEQVQSSPSVARNLFGKMPASATTETNVFGQPTDKSSLFGSDAGLPSEKPSSTSDLQSSVASSGSFASATSSMFSGLSSSYSAATSLLTTGATAACSSSGLLGTSTTSSSTTSGLFGTQQATSSSSEGLFGSTSAPTVTVAGSGGLFGSTSAPTVTVASSEGLFGTTAAPTVTVASSGGLFGTTAAPTVTAASSGGLFGTTAAPTVTVASSGGLFGTTAAPTVTVASSGGLFGAPTAPAATTASSGGLFGAPTAPAAATASAGGLFGTPSVPAATTASSGGIFGAPSTPAATTASSGGIFGASSVPAATTASSGGIFGAPSTPAATTASSGGIFGAPSTPAATTASSGGIFGAPAAPAATTASSGGLFGAPANPAATTASSGGLFGAPANPAATTASSGGLFGAPANPAATTASSGGLFGAPTAPAATTASSAGLFGAPANPAATTASSGGLFGAPANPAATTASSGGLFGARTAPAATTASSGGLFGAPATTTGTGGLFGSTTATETTATASGGNDEMEESLSAPKTGLFGSQPASFGSVQKQQDSPFGGGGFMSGLGGATNQSSASANPFANSSTTNTGGDFKSIFGGNSVPFGGSKSAFGAQSTGTSAFGAQPTGTSAFGAQRTGTSAFGAQPTGTSAFGAQPTGTSAFGAQPTGTSAFGSNQSGGGFGGNSGFGFGAKPAAEQQNTGFGAFNKPSSGFGSAPVFGSSPLGGGAAGGTGFGQKAVFGGSALSPSFGGSGFGSQPNTAAAASGGFAAYASNNTSNTGFGQLAASPNSGGFGSLAANQTSSFGSLAGNQSTGTSAFGGGFGSNQPQNTPKSPSFTQWR